MTKAQIGEHVTPVTKWNPVKDAPDQELTYVDIASVSQTEKTVNGVSHILGAEAPSRARQIIKTGDVLVSTVRPNLNAVAAVPEEMERATASTGFCVLRPNQKTLDSRYLYHWVRSPIFISSMVKQATGQSYPAVSDRVIKQSELPLPPLEEQRRIAAILDQADALRRLRQRVIDRLNTLDRTIFYKMFGDPDTNPKGIEKISLGEIIKVKSGDGLTTAQMLPGPYPVYGGNGINGSHSDGNVEENTIVIGRVGVYCGAVHVSRTSSWVTDNALIVYKKRDIDTFYLAAALRVANLNRYASRSAQPLVSGNRIYPVSILVPDREHQARFGEIVKRYEIECEKQLKSLRKCEDVFSALQQHAFRGEL